VRKKLADIARGLAVLCFALAIGACGGGDGGGDGPVGAPPPPPGTLIGPAGGTVLGPNGAKVVIPAGALATETRINIEEITAGAPPLPTGVAAFGKMFAFTPHGTTFAVPVSMTVPFDPALVPAGVTPALYKTNAAMTAFEPIAGGTVTGDTVTAPVTSFSDGVDGTPPPPVEPVDNPVRVWQFFVFLRDGLEPVAVSSKFTVSSGVVAGGDATHDYGSKPFPTPVSRDHNAFGKVFSTANGRTYWVLADGVSGLTPGGDPQIGSYVDFEQRQSYRRNGEDTAKVKMKITDVYLEGIEANSDETLPFECIEQPECLLELFARLDVSIRVVRSDKRPVFDGSGMVQIRKSSSTAQPLAPKWALDVTTSGRNKFWDASKFILTGARESEAELTLNETLPIEIDLSDLDDKEEVTLIVHVRAKTFNQAQRESFVAAYFRDPVEDEGATIETIGLVPTNNPILDPLGDEIEPAPACTTGVDPAAGTLQFSTAESATLELPVAPQSVLVTRAGGSTGAVSATFSTSNGTAIAGMDYTHLTRTIFFADGDAEPRAVEIPLVLDTVAEPDKTVNLTLSDVRGCAALGNQSTAVLTILDNDRPPPPSAFSVGGTVTGLTGSGLVLSHPTTGENLSTGNGPFTFALRLANGLDYDVVVGTQPGNPAQICTVINGTGTIANANVNNIEVDCVTPPPNGSLDSGFGAGGKVSTGLAGGATALALQRDGKVLMVGKLKLTRHNANGTPDGSFGSGGEVTIRFNGGASDAALDVAVQPDDKIVVAGFTRVGTNDDFAVARFNADGTPDTGFGNSGAASVDFNAAVDKAWAVLIQGDGKIVLAGHSAANSPLGLDNDFAAARFTNTGALDTGFGTGGKVRTNIAGRADFAVAAALQVDGRILLAGRVADGGGDNPDFGLVRYNGDGTPDSGFGTHGIQRQDMTDGNWDEATDLALQADGKIVAAGLAADGGNFTFALARFDANGGRDNGFGTKGFVTTALSALDDFGRGVAVQADGKIVVAGQRSSRQLPDFGIARYDTGGGLDASFGSGGIVSVDFFGAADGAEDIAIQPDGKLVVGGFARNGTSTDLGLVRINP